MSRSRTIFLLLLLPLVGGCGTFDHVFGIFTRQSSPVLVKMIDNPDFPDQRREGINGMVLWNFGRRPPYTTRYAQMSELDPDFTVRAIAVRALNRSRDASATPVFIKELSDPNPLVRLEAAKALNRLPNAAAIPLLIAHLQPTFETGAFDDRGNPIDQDESQDVRIACAEALSHYKTLGVARALVDVLDSRDFGIAWEAHISLQQITGKDFAYNQSSWLDYLSAPGHTLG
jgi:hypothetical protein